MKLELTIPTQMVADAIISGVQGGIQYWAKVTGFWAPARSGCPSESDTDVRLVCDLVELDTSERFSLHEQWATGLRLMAERYPYKFAEVVTGNSDATTGDVFYARVVVMRSPRGKSSNDGPRTLTNCA